MYLEKHYGKIIKLLEMTLLLQGENLDYLANLTKEY